MNSWLVALKHVRPEAITISSLRKFPSTIHSTVLSKPSGQLVEPSRPRMGIRSLYWSSYAWLGMLDEYKSWLTGVVMVALLAADVNIRVVLSSSIRPRCDCHR
jgi:hypothetical protein